MRVRVGWAGLLVMLSAVPLVGPVPARAELREMSTDRPDTTESPFTVDAGHWQLEMSLAEWAHASADGVTVEAWAVAPFNLRYGVTDAIDVDLIVVPYSQATVSEGGHSESSGGFGDSILRLKWNLWGNDSGRSSFALLPYVKLPTANRALGNGHVEGGLILPVAWRFGDAGSLSAMVVFAVQRNQADDGNALDLVQSVSYSHDLPGGFGGFVEYAGLWSPRHDQDYRGFFNAGITRLLGANTQIDAGVRFGLTGASDDYSAFVGVAWRY